MYNLVIYISIVLLHCFSFIGLSHEPHPYSVLSPTGQIPIIVTMSPFVLGYRKVVTGHYSEIVVYFLVFYPFCCPLAGANGSTHKTPLFTAPGQNRIIVGKPGEGATSERRLNRLRTAHHKVDHCLYVRFDVKGSADGGSATVKSNLRETNDVVKAF